MYNTGFWYSSSYVVYINYLLPSSGDHFYFRLAGFNKPFTKSNLTAIWLSRIQLQLQYSEKMNSYVLCQSDQVPLGQ